MRALFFLFAVVACDSQLRSDPRPDPPPPPPPADPAVQRDMNAHFDAGAAVRAAIVAGDVAAARAGFESLASSAAPEGLPAGSEPLFVAMIGAARQGAGASTAAQQAVALGDTLRACGGCHALVHARPAWRVPAAPSRDPGIQLHMARHAWAVDRMVEGLVGPTEAGWAQASAILRDEPVDAAELSRGLSLSPEAAAAGERLHQLGLEARQATTAEARSAAFAETLTTCATCHVAVRSGPPR